MRWDIHTVILILLSMFEMWMCWQVLYWTVLEKQDLKNWRKVMIWGNIIGLGILLGINRNMFYFSHSMFLLWVMLTAITILLLCAKRKWLVLSMAVIFEAFLSILDFFFAFCGMIALDDFYDMIYVYGNSPWKCLLFAMSRIGIFCVLLCMKKYKWEKEIFQQSSVFFIAASVLLVIILRIYQHIIVNMIEGVWNIKWWGAAGSLAGIVIITAFCMGIWWKNQNLKKEYQILEIKRTSEEEKYREMAQVLEKNRIQIHDIKNHLLLLREFAVKENYDELKQYLNEVWGEYTATKGKMWTQNEVLDTFLDKKMQEAEMEGMEFRIEADVLRKVPLTKTELCVLFGNLLDNAIEACSKIQVGKKKISVKISRKKNFLFIFIANTIQERPREKKGELVSDKKNAELHGYGLKSVKQIVEKYGGTFQYEIKDDQFEVHIAFLGDER